jgi:hypothetical protein
VAGLVGWMLLGSAWGIKELRLKVRLKEQMRAWRDEREEEKKEAGRGVWGECYIQRGEGEGNG